MSRPFGVSLNLMRLELIFSIHRATHRIGLYIQRHAPELTQAEAHILCHLHEFGDSAVSDLHRAFAHKRSTLTSVLDRLDARGLVTRESSQKDRRSFVVRLTPSGKKKAAKIHRQLEALEARVLRANDRRAVEAFGQVIRDLEENAAEE
jgi:DNA-binding MarR family transcriptional regulator